MKPTPKKDQSAKKDVKAKTAPQKKPSKKKKSGETGPLRLWARIGAATLVVGFVLLCICGDIYVHHPAAWLASHRSLITAPLEYLGDRTAFITDALGWTGRDAVNTPDDPIPEGMVSFAGDPVRVGAPAPADIVVLDRGEFRIGRSPSLRHPVWVAYHVPRTARHEAGKRPNFQKDKGVASSPQPKDYANSGYDRGHMAPNHAIATRFGPEIQRRTFQMTNVAPQRPGLNRGPWREMEQRISELWTSAYGEIWVIVGTVPPAPGQSRSKLGQTDINVPEQFYMVIASQTEDSVRMLAVLMNQTARRWDFPVHNIVSVDEIEKLTGLDFFPDMQRSLQMSLEADTPTRLWPVRVRDLLKLILIRFT